MNYFFDTSALFKLFVAESNAAQVQSIYLTFLLLKILLKRLVKTKFTTLDAFQLAAFQSHAAADWHFLTADIGLANAVTSLKINVLVV